jgi:hypothetical protein
LALEGVDLVEKSFVGESFFSQLALKVADTGLFEESRLNGSTSAHVVDLRLLDPKVFCLLHYEHVLLCDFGLELRGFRFQFIEVFLELYKGLLTIKTTLSLFGSTVFVAGGSKLAGVLQSFAV